VFFEGSAHVPLLVRPPGGSWNPDERAGSRHDGLVCLADVFPSILGMAGVEAPQDVQLDGLDVMQALEGNQQRGVLVGECGSYYMVRDGRYKYTFTEAGGAELMFDLAEDPYETHDLLGAGEKPDVAERLRGILVEHLEKRQPEAVQDGRPAATREPRELHETRKRVWPGFHDRNYPCDVLH
jgi:arylsulfatase A-like enzyme